MTRESQQSPRGIRSLLGQSVCLMLLLGLSVAVAPAASAAAGESWTARSAAAANQWQSVTYGNGVFVAVANSGSNRVMSSTDGVTWTARSAAQDNNWQGVAYGNGVFVAVAEAGTNRVMTSTNGVTWTARSAAEANSWQWVTYGNGVFVAVAASGTNRVMTSTDGETWTARTAAAASGWNSVTYGNGVFVAVAGSGANQVMTSTNGVTWTARSAAEANNWYAVTYGNGVFAAVSSDGTNRVMTSTNGETWTARSAAEANFWRSVTFGNGVFVAVANTGTNRVMTSTNGETWTAHTAAQANLWISVTYGSGVFVAVSFDGTNRVMTSGVYTPISVPAAPTSLVATAGDGSASIAFTAGADGGASITNYEYQLNGAGSWVALSPADASSPVTIGGLTNGTAYTVKLRAVNSVGSGAESVASDSFTPAAVPSAPTSLVATAGVGSASIAFTAGADGGASISKYQYQLGSGSWVDAVGTTSPITVSGLTNGTSYSIKLRAVNSAGDGVASDAVSVTPRTVPGAPSVSSVTPDNSAVSVAFTAGATGGSVITDYEYQLNGSGSWFSLGTTSSPASIGVTNGVAYTVRLRAVNVAGSGAASDASGSFTPRTTPSAPTGLSATPGNASASIAFTPGADGGASITKYQYKVGSGSWTDAVGTTSPITVTGLTNYQTANIKLRAVNSAGFGVASAPVSVTPRQAGPAVTSATPSGRTGIVVTFSLNPLPGTTVAYQSVVAYARGTNTVAGSCRTYATRTTCYIGGLTRATNYDLRVTAHLPVPGKSWHNTTAEGSVLQVRTNN